MANLPEYISALISPSEKRWFPNQKKFETKIITFSYLNNSDNVNGNGEKKWEGFKEFTLAEKFAVKRIFNLYERFANLKFKLIPSGGNIQFGHKDLPFIGSSTGVGSANKPSRIWIDGIRNVYPGYGGIPLLIHEIGHSLGLKHPGNYNGEDGGVKPFLPYSKDNRDNTIMSYNKKGKTPITPMPYDIAAIQYLYGARKLNRGNTTYRFNNVNSFSDGLRNWGSKNRKIRLALHDSGGIDTLDFSKLDLNSSGYRFDIRQGGYITTKKAYKAKIYTPIDNSKDTSDLRYKATDFGTVISMNPKVVASRDNIDSAIENVIGSSSHDLIIGNARKNVLHGKAGNDELWGLERDDVLKGWQGRDSLLGGTGNDILWGHQDNDLLKGWHGNDELLGGTGNDNLYGENGNDSLKGWHGHDRLIGGAGADKLYGENGNDRLIGGKGLDILVGGRGADRFVYTSIKDAPITNNALAADSIRDFSFGDKIDFSMIDADLLFRGNQKFKFIGSNEFTGTGAEVRYSSLGSNAVWVEADLHNDGNKASDLRMIVFGVSELTANSFVL